MSISICGATIALVSIIWEEGYMKRRVVSGAMAIGLALLLALSSCASAYAATANAGDKASAANAVPKTATHGIPLMTIEIDEDKTTLDAMLEQDPKHTYGTIADMNASEDHSVRCVGSVRIDVPDGYKGPYGNVTAPEGEIEMKFIRGRGKSTWGMGIKKPYRLQLQEPLDLFGMGEGVAWTLLSNENDPSLLRNRLTYWLGDEIGLPFTPQQVPVDVVMVGSESGANYLGSYTLSEPVRFGDGRIEVPELDKNDTDNLTITGGYLLSICSAQDEGEPDSTIINTDSGIEMLCEYPEFKTEDLTEGEKKQRAYIRDFLNSVDIDIMTPGDIDEKRHQVISEVLDLNSTADYWWIQEFSCNPDAYKTSSTYLYKDRIGDASTDFWADGKLCWGPLWDFDVAWMLDEDVEYGSMRGFNNTEFAWLDRLRDKDPQFVELLKQRWKDPSTGMYVKLGEMIEPGGALDQYRDEIEASWEADAKRWSEDMGADPVVLEMKKDLDSTIERLRKWIKVRRAWVNKHLDEIDHVYYTMTYLVDGDEYQSVSARGGSYLAYPPEAPEREGKLFAGWKKVDTGEDCMGYRVIGDAEFEAAYISQDEAVMPEHIFFSSYECWTKMQRGTVFSNPLVTIPSNASVDTVRWTTSNEDVAVATRHGSPLLVGAGTCTISATFPNGKSVSYVLHVCEPEDMKEIDPVGFLVSEAPMRLEVGSAAQIDAKMVPERTALANMPVKYESSDPFVASIYEGGAGVIMGNHPGTATITVTALNEDGTAEFHAERDVVVVEQGEDSRRQEAALLDRQVRQAVPWVVATLLLGTIIAVMGLRNHMDTN